MPVHGEWRHLRANADLAVAHRRAARARRARRGRRRSSTWSTGVAAIVGAVPCGYVYVDGSSVGDVTETSLKDRRILGDGGLHLGLRRRRLGDRQGRRRPGDPRARLRRGRLGLRRRPPAIIAAALEDALRRGRRRHLPAAAGRPPGRRPLGQRHAPPPPDDHPGRRRGLTALRHPASAAVAGLAERRDTSPGGGRTACDARDRGTRG